MLHGNDPLRVGNDLDVNGVLLALDTSGENLVLIGAVGVADAHLEHESVQLSLGQWVGSFLLDGVLCSHRQER